MAENTTRELTRAPPKKPVGTTPSQGARPPAKGQAGKSVRRPTSGREKIKTIVIIIFVVIFVLEAIFFVLFIGGMSDMLDDESYFVGLQTDGVFKAGTYWRKSDENKITFDVEKLGAYTEQYSQQNFNTLSNDATNTHGPLDRMMVWSSGSIRELHGDKMIVFRSNELTVDQLLDYINFQDPPSTFYYPGETTQDVRAKMFNAWIDQYFGNTVNTISEFPIVLDKIGEGKIDLYPSNIAVTLLTIFPVLGLIL